MPTTNMSNDQMFKSLKDEMDEIKKSLTEGLLEIDNKLNLLVSSGVGAKATATTTGGAVKSRAESIKYEKVFVSYCSSSDGRKDGKTFYQHVTTGPSSDDEDSMWPFELMNDEFKADVFNTTAHKMLAHDAKIRVRATHLWQKCIKICPEKIKWARKFLKELPPVEVDVSEVKVRVEAAPKKKKTPVKKETASPSKTAKKQKSPVKKVTEASASDEDLSSEDG